MEKQVSESDEKWPLPEPEKWLSTMQNRGNSTHPNCLPDILGFRTPWDTLIRRNQFRRPWIGGAGPLLQDLQHPESRCFMVFSGTFRPLRVKSPYNPHGNMPYPRGSAKTAYRGPFYVFYRILAKSRPRCTIKQEGLRQKVVSGCQTGQKQSSGNSRFSPKSGILYGIH